MVRIIEELAGDWRRPDERIEGLSGEVEAIAREDTGCERLMSVPGIGPIISSATVAAIGTGDTFSKGRDFAAWLGLVRDKSRRAIARSSARHRSAAGTSPPAMTNWPPTTRLHQACFDRHLAARL
jgi:transposase